MWTSSSDPSIMYWNLSSPWCGQLHVLGIFLTNEKRCYIFSDHMDNVPGYDGSRYICSDHVSNVSANERRCYICNIFSHWLRHCSHYLRHEPEHTPWSIMLGMLQGAILIQFICCKVPSWQRSWWPKLMPGSHQMLKSLLKVNDDQYKWTEVGH